MWNYGNETGKTIISTDLEKKQELGVTTLQLGGLEALSSRHNYLTQQRVWWHEQHKSICRQLEGETSGSTPPCCHSSLPHNTHYHTYTSVYGLKVCGLNSAAQKSLWSFTINFHSNTQEITIHCNHADSRNAWVSSSEVLLASERVC